MNIDTVFPSKYVSAADLNNQEVRVVMGAVQLESVDDGKPMLPVLYFQGMTKGLVLNKTNAKKLSELYGSETDHWAGQAVTLFAIQTEYQGKPTPGIRVKAAPMQPVGQAAIAQQASQQPAITQQASTTQPATGGVTF